MVLATSALERGSPLSSNTASPAGCTNRLRRRRLAGCVSSSSETALACAATWTAIACCCLTTRISADRPTRFMMVAPLRRVAGPAATGTRHQARGMVAGFGTPSMSAHELFPPEQHVNNLSSSSTRGASSPQRRPQESTYIVVSASWATGKYVTNDAGRELLLRDSLAHDAVPEVVLRRQSRYRSAGRGGVLP